MKENGVLYLDDFLSTDVNETFITADSIEKNSFKEIYEIEEYILRKQAENMNVAPEVFYREEFFPTLTENKTKETQKKTALKKLKRHQNYKPKNIRGQGVFREGLCEECNKWFRLKTSSYWYHMNFKHGIAANGMTYPEPEVYYNKGKAFSVCKSCNAEVPLGGNNKTLKYNWYKHFQKEHAKLYE